MAVLGKWNPNFNKTLLTRIFEREQGQVTKLDPYPELAQTIEDLLEVNSTACKVAVRRDSNGEPAGIIAKARNTPWQDGFESKGISILTKPANIMSHEGERYERAEIWFGSLDYMEAVLDINDPRYGLHLSLHKKGEAFPTVQPARLGAPSQKGFYHGFMPRELSVLLFVARGTREWESPDKFGFRRENSYQQKLLPVYREKL